MSQISIALAQLECHDGFPEKNLARLDGVVKDYGSSHDVILFPETFVMGVSSPEINRSLAEPLDGPVIKHLENKAKEANTTIVTNIFEKEDNSVYNTSVLVGPTGLLLSYRKSHLWVGEEKWGSPGRKFSNCKWNGTKVGLLICFDIEFPETARAVACMGTELLFLTNGNMHPYGPAHQTAIKARAQENQMFIAATNRVGKLTSPDYPDITFVGESLIADPYGRIIAEAGNEEEIVSATIDLSLVQESRKTYHYLKECRIPIGVKGINFKENIQELMIEK